MTHSLLNNNNPDISGEASPIAFIPTHKLDADQYSAEDFDGVTESLFGSGGVSYASLQASLTDAVLLQDAITNAHSNTDAQQGNIYSGASPAPSLSLGEEEIYIQKVEEAQEDNASNLINDHGGNNNGQHPIAANTIADGALGAVGASSAGLHEGSGLLGGGRGSSASESSSDSNTGSTTSTSSSTISTTTREVVGRNGTDGQDGIDADTVQDGNTSYITNNTTTTTNNETTNITTTTNSTETTLIDLDDAVGDLTVIITDVTNVLNNLLSTLNLNHLLDINNVTNLIGDVTDNVTGLVEQVVTQITNLTDSLSSTLNSLNLDDLNLQQILGDKLGIVQQLVGGTLTLLGDKTGLLQEVIGGLGEKLGTIPNIGGDILSKLDQLQHVGDTVQELVSHVLHNPLIETLTNDIAGGLLGGNGGGIGDIGDILSGGLLDNNLVQTVENLLGGLPDGAGEIGNIGDILGGGLLDNALIGNVLEAPLDNVGNLLGGLLGGNGGAGNIGDIGDIVSGGLDNGLVSTILDALNNAEHVLDGLLAGAGGGAGNIGDVLAGGILDNALIGNVLEAPLDNVGNLLGGVLGNGSGGSGDTDLGLGLDIAALDNPLISSGLDVPLDIAENLLGDVDLGLGLGLDLLGTNETDNAAGDTDLVLQTGIDLVDHNLLGGALEVGLDPVEALVGDIDIDLNLAGNVLGNIAPNVLDGSAGGSGGDNLLTQIHDLGAGAVSHVMDGSLGGLANNLLHNAGGDAPTNDNLLVDLELNAIGIDGVDIEIEDPFGLVDSLNGDMDIEIDAALNVLSGNSGLIESHFSLGDIAMPAANDLLDNLGGLGGHAALPDPVGHIAQGLGAVIPHSVTHKLGFGGGLFG